jgi:hypothetical protein
LGKVSLPPPVLFFSSIIFNDPAILGEVEQGLAGAIGPVLEKTEMMPFCESGYYGDEMGESLNRYFLLFEPLVGRDSLAGIKKASNEIETATADGARRRVNIDPGYIALEHIVLGTTKGYSHRIYVGDGIFADLTLLYENGTYCPLKWTYPDYGGERLVRLLNGWRENYKRFLRCQKA